MRRNRPQPREDELKPETAPRTAFPREDEVPLSEPATPPCPIKVLHMDMAHGESRRPFEIAKSRDWEGASLLYIILNSQLYFLHKGGDGVVYEGWSNVR